MPAAAAAAAAADNENKSGKKERKPPPAAAAAAAAAAAPDTPKRKSARTAAAAATAIMAVASVHDRKPPAKTKSSSRTKTPAKAATSGKKKTPAKAATSGKKNATGKSQQPKAGNKSKKAAGKSNNKSSQQIVSAVLKKGNYLQQVATSSAPRQLASQRESQQGSKRSTLSKKRKQQLQWLLGSQESIDKTKAARIRHQQRIAAAAAAGNQAVAVGPPPNHYDGYVPKLLAHVTENPNYGATLVQVHPDREETYHDSMVATLKRDIETLLFLHAEGFNAKKFEENERQIAQLSLLVLKYKRDEEVSILLDDMLPQMLEEEEKYSAKWTEIEADMSMLQRARHNFFLVIPGLDDIHDMGFNAEALDATLVADAKKHRDKHLEILSSISKKYTAEPDDEDDDVPQVFFGAATKSKTDKLSAQKLAFHGDFSSLSSNIHQIEAPLLHPVATGDVPLLPAELCFMVQDLPLLTLNDLCCHYGSATVQNNFHEFAGYISPSLEDHRRTDELFDEVKQSLSKTDRATKGPKIDMLVHGDYDLFADTQQEIINYEFSKGASYNMPAMGEWLNLLRHTASPSAVPPVPDENLAKIGLTKQPWLDTPRAKYYFDHWRVDKSKYHGTNVPTEAVAELNLSSFDSVALTDHGRQGLEKVGVLVKAALTRVLGERLQLEISQCHQPWTGQLQSGTTSSHQDLHTDNIKCATMDHFEEAVLGDNYRAVTADDWLRFGYVVDLPLSKEGSVVRIACPDPKTKTFIMKYVYVPFGSMFVRSQALVHSGHYGNPGNIRLHIVVSQKGNEPVTDTLLHFRELGYFVRGGFRSLDDEGKTADPKLDGLKDWKLQWDFGVSEVMKLPNGIISNPKWGKIRGSKAKYWDIIFSNPGNRTISTNMYAAVLNPMETLVACGGQGPEKQKNGVPKEEPKQEQESPDQVGADAGAVEENSSSSSSSSSGHSDSEVEKDKEEEKSSSSQEEDQSSAAEDG